MTDEIDCPLSVLIVDDDSDTATSLTTILAMLGFQARSATSGREALLAAAADHPDVVLLDLMMPGMDGCDLTRRLRDQVNGKQLLIVAITGCDSGSNRMDAKDAGIDLYLLKPVEPATVVGILKRFARVRSLTTAISATERSVST